MQRPRRVLGYARVSSKHQVAGTSLRDQEESIRAYAAARGLTLAHCYVEAESGIHEKIERREQMRALLADVREGDLIICDKLDRWSRDPEFTYKSVREILAAGASFYAVSDRCDPSTSEGDTALGFRILFAREEHKRIKERMIGTRRLLRDQGYYVEGELPYGYRRHSSARGAEHNVLVIEPAEAKVVRTIYRLYIGGMSIARIALDLEMRRDLVHRILKRRHYAGEIQNSRGEWIVAKHPAIVDKATFVRAEELRGKRRLGGPRPREGGAETDGWILRDVALCARCGAKMSAAYSGPHGPRRRHYYCCSARCRSLGNRATNGAFVPVPAIEAEAAALVVARLGAVAAELSGGPEPAPSKVGDPTAKLAKLEERRQRYVEAFADGAMTREELAAARAKLDAERLRLEATVARPTALASAKPRRAALHAVEAIADAWDRATGPERRAIVNQLAVSFAVERGCSPAPRWRPLEELAAILVR